jgi:hypothetical protein
VSVTQTPVDAPPVSLLRRAHLDELGVSEKRQEHSLSLKMHLLSSPVDLSSARACDMVMQLRSCCAHEKYPLVGWDASFATQDLHGRRTHMCVGFKQSQLYPSLQSPVVHVPAPLMMLWTRAHLFFTCDPWYEHEHASSV